MSSTLNALRKHTPKFSYLNRCFGNNNFKVLDVGSGNHSASKTKSVFPNCEYHGVDLDKFYNNDESDFRNMHAFYELDLTSSDLANIPNDYFDFILMSHIIEHLENGDQVILKLLPKLKAGGYIYIEYPGIRSTKLPSMHGTLNFYDDSTHVRIYSVEEISFLLRTAGMQVLRAGTRRNLAYLLAMPFNILRLLIQGKKMHGMIFWDLLGFAEYVFAKKS